MKRKSILFVALLATMMFISFVQTSSANDVFAVGKTVENFKLPDTNGKSNLLTNLKGKNGAVVIFLSAQCPVVKGYNERINQNRRRLSSQRNKFHRHQFQRDRIARLGEIERRRKL